MCALFWLYHLERFIKPCIIIIIINIVIIIVIIVGIPNQRIKEQSVPFGIGEREVRVRNESLQIKGD